MLACRADAFGALTNLFIHQVFRWQRERAREAGLGKVRSGAVVMQHRAGASLNLHPHLHAVLADGVFCRTDAKGRVDFHRLVEPTPEDLEEIALNTHQRFRRWLERHGLLRQGSDDFSNETRELSPLEACSQGSLGLGGMLTTVQGKPRSHQDQGADHEQLDQHGSSPLVGQAEGYNLYVGHAIPGESHDARERLLRYCLRGPLSLERLSVARDGRVVYQVKATRRGRETRRIMTPLEFMARLVALIAPCHHPLLRYFGVFAPHSCWRSCVVPVDDEDAKSESGHDHRSTQGDVAGTPAPPVTLAAALPDAGLSLDTPPSPAGSPRPSTGVVASASVDPPRSVATARAAERPAPRPRWYIPWAELLRRVYDFDALRCACGGKLRFKQLVTEPEVARAILRSMGLPSDAPPVAKARSPTFDPDPLPAEWD